MTRHLLWGGFVPSDPLPVRVHDLELIEMTYAEMHELKYLLAELGALPGLTVCYHPKDRCYTITCDTPLIDSLNFSRLEYP